ncbi:GNAT family N-acetyltransferase [Candidatus Pelagibacter sp.]|nr:GNAT family N-acetyltransferase [Candidatus Pelagibacter sp.]|tara:strand:+ start:196 stop:705 length:510 start_codon:yes stop_codon:yes gene_type:complete
MMINVERNFLEIRDVKNLKINPTKKIKFLVKKINPDFQLNKFFYKQVGKKHRWLDRLNWSDEKWINYISNKNLDTYIISDSENLVGFFELLNNPHLSETEISYFGLLEEYIGRGIGGYALSVAIRKSFEKDIKRVWLHTCTLDHPNALKNYIARGMTVFKKENINIIDN